MSKQQQIAEAKRLRAEGLSYRAIGERLGVTNSTVLRWLKPSKAKQYDKNRRERYANDPEFAEIQRQRVNESKRGRYATDPEFRAREKKRVARRNREQYTSNQEFRLQRLLYGSSDRAKKRNHAPCNATVAELVAAFNECGGCCQCCGKHESELSKRLVIDHDHTTGKFRGFLCDNCNRGIGFLEDSAYLAFNYLDPDRSQLLFGLLKDSYKPQK